MAFILFISFRPFHGASLLCIAMVDRLTWKAGSAGGCIDVLMSMLVAFCTANIARHKDTRTSVMSVELRPQRRVREGVWGRSRDKFL